jgi:AcrR family transcriptional regulator
MEKPTRQRLLDAAWTCVRRGGIAGASSRAITTQAGANLGAISYHFGSKDELLAAAFVAGIRRLVAPAIAALEQEGVDPVVRLFQAIPRLQASLAESAEEAPVLLEVLVQSRHMPALRGEVGELFAELRSSLAGLMAEQREKGLLPAWVEPKAMAALLLAVAQGVVLETTIDPAGPPQGPIAGQFAQLLIASRPHPADEPGPADPRPAPDRPSSARSAPDRPAPDRPAMPPD